MARSKQKRSRPTAKHRASWKGQFTFGLVSFAVEAFNALDRQHSDIHFHQIHAECHRRIRHQKVCPVHGEVSNEEIVSGYEYKKGKYVEVEPEELEALRTKSDRALKVEAFVSPDTVDPLYFDGRMYFLVPSGSAAHRVLCGGCGSNGARGTLCRGAGGLLREEPDRARAAVRGCAAHGHAELRSAKFGRRRQSPGL